MNYQCSAAYWIVLFNSLADYTEADEPKRDDRDDDKDSIQDFKTAALPIPSCSMELKARTGGIAWLERWN